MTGERGCIGSSKGGEGGTLSGSAEGSEKREHRNKTLDLAVNQFYCRSPNSTRLPPLVDDSAMAGGLQARNSPRFQYIVAVSLLALGACMHFSLSSATHEQDDAEAAEAPQAELMRLREELLEVTQQRDALRDLALACDPGAERRAVTSVKQLEATRGELRRARASTRAPCTAESTSQPPPTRPGSRFEVVEWEAFDARYVYSMQRAKVCAPGPSSCAGLTARRRCCSRG